jgi:hypothetical protein
MKTSRVLLPFLVLAPLVALHAEATPVPPDCAPSPSLIP